MVAARAARAAGAARGLRRAARRLRRARPTRGRSRARARAGSPGSRACSLDAGRAARCSTIPRRRRSLVAVWAFLGGGLYGARRATSLGGLLLVSARAALGSRGSYRRARHVARVRGRSARALAPLRLADRGSRSTARPVPDAAAATTAAPATSFALVALAFVVVGARAARRSASASSTAGPGARSPRPSRSRGARCALASRARYRARRARASAASNARAPRPASRTCAAPRGTRRARTSAT